MRDNEPERSFDLGEVTAWDLLATFSRLMRETLAGRPHTVRSDPRPLRWYVQTIGSAVRANRSGTSLRQLVEDLGDVPTREGLVGAFCALLELMKIGLISARQETQNDEIVLEWAAPPGSGEDLEDLIRVSRFMDEDSEELDGVLEDASEESSEEPGEGSSDDAEQEPESSHEDPEEPDADPEDPPQPRAEG